MKHLWHKKMPWVYFVECVGHDIIKIGGTSTGVRARINNLQHSCPFDLVCIGAYAATPEEEGRLHKQFASLRLRGEWFRASLEMRDYIKLACPEFDLNESDRTALVPDLKIKFAEFLAVSAPDFRGIYLRQKLEVYCKKRHVKSAAMHAWLDGKRYPSLQMIDIAERFMEENA